MKSAPVQNPSPVASHADAFRRHPGIYRGDTCAFRILLITFVTCFFFPVFSFSQVDTNTQNFIRSKAIDTSQFAISGKIDHLPNYARLSKQQKRQRQWVMGGLNVIGYGTSILVFNNQWYKDYPKTSFHTFNDSKEWLQMDKIGHAWAAYNSGRASAAMWRWAGVEPKKAAWIGGLSSSLYLTVIEILDAHSAKWGWSWTDMAANVFGSGLFISQELGWQQQRIRLKFSFHQKNYGEAMLKERADDLFGEAWTERMLKDYNGQTYWLSANLKSFFPKSNLPAWLNIAVGYGADGMFGGFENKWENGDPGFPIDRTDIKRYRQWYLSPDIDFSSIKTNKKAVKILLAALDAFKFPAPSLELSNGRLTVNAIHF